MNATLSLPYLLSLSVGRPEIVARFNFYSLFVVLPVTAVLIYFFGLSGAGFSWVFYHLFAYVYVVPRICSECLEIPVSTWYLQILRVVGISGLAYGGAWTALKLTGSDSALLIGLAYCLASAVFLGAAYWMIGEELRSLFRSLSIFRQSRSPVWPL
jgi:hypothetical protein